MFKFLKSKSVVSTNIETKSVNNQLTGSVSSIYSDFPSSVYMPSDSVGVLNYNRGYANACCRVISQAVADLPYYLYRVAPKNGSKYLGKSMSVNDKNFLTKINKSFKTGDYTLDKIFEHPFLQIFEDNMTSSVSEFFYLIAAYLTTIGNCYILIERDPRGALSNLKILMSEYMSVKTTSDNVITSYVYQPLLTGAKSVTYLPEDILHIKRLTAGSIIVGKGVLEEALLSVSCSEESKKHLNCLLNNHMTPQNMIIIKNSIKNETEATRIKDKFIEQFSGYNRGRNLVTFGEIDIKPLASNMNDNQVVQINEFVRKEVCSIFGVPNDILNTENGNRATAITAKNNFLKFTVFPMAELICSQITKQLIAKEYDNTFVLNWDNAESLENDPIEQSQLIKNYLDAGIIDVNEARTMLGMGSKTV